MKVYKFPTFEDDSYMFVLEQSDVLTEISLFDLDYYNAKREAFKMRDDRKCNLSDFLQRPSMRNFDEVEDLHGTIYTATVFNKNKMLYEEIIERIKANYGKSRRCNINFADTLRDYLDASKNTSCLNAIHYYKDNVTVYFRASDIKNELLIDLHLIKEFFIDTVSKTFKTITVIASTAQGVDYTTDLKGLVKYKTNNYEFI